jgi:hypothetical protein
VLAAWCVVGVAALAFAGAGAATRVLLAVAGSGFGVSPSARRCPTRGRPAARAGRDVLVWRGTVAFLSLQARRLQRGSVPTATAAMVVTQTVVPAAAGVLLGDRVREGSCPWPCSASCWPWSGRSAWRGTRAGCSRPRDR